MDWLTQTNWLYGEVGSRLDSNRSNDYFKNSSKEIKNAYITQTGTLRVMKQWLNSPLSSFAGKIIDVLETRYNFYIVVTTTKILLYRYTDHTKLSELAHVTAQDSNCAVVFKNYLVISKTSTPVFLKFENDGSSIVVYDFQAEFKPPLKDRQVVKFDVHKVYEETFIEKTDPTTGVVTIGKRKTVQRIASQIVDPEIKVDGAGYILLANQGGKVARIYGEPILDFRIDEEITGSALKYGELIINFTTGIPNNLLFNTEKVTYDSVKTDKNRGYVTKFTNTSSYNKEGKLYRGEVIDILSNTTSVSLFQNRLVITDDESVYFSKVNDMFDFTNYIEDDSPFYIKPNPIINEQPVILKTYSSRGLYIITDKGIYVMGYNVNLSPSTATVETVSDTPATNRVAMIDSNFFFIGKDSHLYSVQEDTELSRARLFKYVVEKYDLNFVADDITTVRFDKFKRLVVKEKGTGQMYLYDVILGVDTFRRTSFDFDYDVTSRICGVNEHLITDDSIHLFSNKNYPEMSVKVHQPSDMMTQTGGTLGNDDNTTVETAQMSIINEGGNSIQQVLIDGLGCSNLGDQDNMMSFYNVMNLSRQIKEGFHYTVRTGESTGTVEITAIEYMYNLAGLY